MDESELKLRFEVDDLESEVSDSQVFAAFVAWLESHAADAPAAAPPLLALAGARYFVDFQPTGGCTVLLHEQRLTALRPDAFAGIVLLRRARG